MRALGKAQILLAYGDKHGLHFPFKLILGIIYVLLAHILNIL